MGNWTIGTARRVRRPGGSRETPRLCGPGTESGALAPLVYPAKSSHFTRTAQTPLPKASIAARSHANMDILMQPLTQCMERCRAIRVVLWKRNDRPSLTTSYARGRWDSSYFPDHILSVLHHRPSLPNLSSSKVTAPSTP